ncbi:hypothetical protein ACHAXR_003963, partial [Thalassiosira sp. AJA248-18]
MASRRSELKSTPNNKTWRWRAVALAILSVVLCTNNNHHHVASAFSINLRRQRHPQLTSLSSSHALIAHRRNNNNFCHNSEREESFLKSSTAAAAASSVVSEHAIALQPEINVQEAPMNQQLDENSSVILAARIVEGEECEGYLVQKLDGNKFEAHMSCGNDVTDVDKFTAVFHKLLLQYLSIEFELYEKERDGGRCNGDKYSSQLRALVMDSGMEKSLSGQLEQIGFPMPSSIEPHQNDGYEINLAKYIPYLNEFAFRHRGTEQGNTALLVLKMLSQRRVSLDFDDHTMHQHPVSSRDHLTIEQSGRRRNVISYQKQILPYSAVEEVIDVVEEIKSRKWLSDNPDSVDGLPSLHLNLITNGKPLFEKTDDDRTGSDTTTFPQCISKMVDILHPHLYDNLLPSVRKVTNSSTVEISDVFIRNYGRIDDEESATTRYGLSSHYDVTAYATCVVTLDSTASTGRNGLYTILPTPGVGAASHAGLRKFFPLGEGDGVVHTYDVLHGVDVDPGLNRSRTSLIIWFTDGEDEDDHNVNQPWLLNPADDIGEFVLGVALESAVEENECHMVLKNNSVDKYSMYLSSATGGNIFAMTSLAQMCYDDLVPGTQFEKISNVLASRDECNPFLSTSGDVSLGKNELAKALWYHAAIQGGHRVAQVSLADDIMAQYMRQKDDMEPTEKESMLLMASALFTMALVQGYDSKESLKRLMNVECDRLNRMGIEIPGDEFYAS